MSPNRRDMNPQIEPNNWDFLQDANVDAGDSCPGSTSTSSPENCSSGTLWQVMQGGLVYAAAAVGGLGASFLFAKLFLQIRGVPLDDDHYWSLFAFPFVISLVAIAPLGSLIALKILGLIISALGMIVGPWPLVTLDVELNRVRVMPASCVVRWC